MNPDIKVLTYKGKVVFEKIKMTSFERLPKIYESNEACFMFVNEGEFSVRTPDEVISFKNDKGMLAKCFDYFFEMSKSQRKGNDCVEVLGILLFPSIVEELFQFDVNTSRYTVDFNVKQIPIEGLLNSFKDSINILIDNPELADEEMIKNKLKEFILLISKVQNAPSHIDFLSAMFKKNAIEFRSTIQNNMYANLSNDAFAHLCGMSVSSFKRKFSEVYDESPKKYFAKMKLQKASKMLLTDDIRIYEIAYDCGFETISTFNRTFKTHFGQSPSEYRLSRTA